MSADTQFQLQWRGKSHGPWTYAEIQERLAEGEIHSLYQVRIDGAWRIVAAHVSLVDPAVLRGGETAR